MYNWMFYCPAAIKFMEMEESRSTRCREKWNENIFFVAFVPRTTAEPNKFSSALSYWMLRGTKLLRFVEVVFLLLHSIEFHDFFYSAN